MVTKEDLIFRQVVTLRDGARVLLRPLVPEDKQALLDLYLPVSFEERRYMRHNVNDAALISSWAEDIDYDKVFPLVAVINDRIVGAGTLHFSDGVGRHRCEMRIFLSKEFRHRGLGSKLIQALVDLAKKRGMYMVEVYIVSDHVEVIKAVQKVGFQNVTVLEDYYMLPDGDLRDVAYHTLRLRSSENEF
ncbi:MAG: GNAT family N-acetyltransferase [Anaerolineales bacterium]|nr:GNAT family N-acetyltransferase [Anaerolineales bacterium]